MVFAIRSWVPPRLPLVSKLVYEVKSSLAFLWCDQRGNKYCCILLCCMYMWSEEELWCIYDIFPVAFSILFLILSPPLSYLLTIWFCSSLLTCQIIDAWVCNFRALSTVRELSPWSKVIYAATMLGRIHGSLSVPAAHTSYSSSIIFCFLALTALNHIFYFDPIHHISLSNTYCQVR